MKFSRLMGALLGLLLGGSAWAVPVNVNTADRDALAAVNGIGLAKAEAIIAYRDANGPFKSVDELVSVKGIGSKLLELLRPQVSVGGPPVTP